MPCSCVKFRSLIISICKYYALVLFTRYELCLNVDVAGGLANGAGGTVKKTQLTSDDSSASGFIWVQFF